MAVKNPWTWDLGRRKKSIARVRLKPGTGAVVVNGKPVEQFFPTLQSLRASNAPLVATESATTPTTPHGSTVLKLKNGPCTGFWLPSRLSSLSGNPAYQTTSSIAAATSASASLSVRPTRASSVRRLPPCADAYFSRPARSTATIRSSDT